MYAKEKRMDDRAIKIITALICFQKKVKNKTVHL